MSASSPCPRKLAPRVEIVADADPVLLEHFIDLTVKNPWSSYYVSNERKKTWETTCGSYSVTNETGRVHCRVDTQRYARKNHDIWDTPLKGVKKASWTDCSAQIFMRSAGRALIDSGSLDRLSFCHDRPFVYQYTQAEWAITINSAATDSMSWNTFVRALNSFTRVTPCSY